MVTAKGRVYLKPFPAGRHQHNTSTLHSQLLLFPGLQDQGCTDDHHSNAHNG